MLQLLLQGGAQRFGQRGQMSAEHDIRPRDGFRGGEDVPGHEGEVRGAQGGLAHSGPAVIPAVQPLRQRLTLFGENGARAPRAQRPRRLCNSG